MVSRKGFLLATGLLSLSTLGLAQPVKSCQFQFPFAGIKLNDVYNGPIACRGVALDHLKANGNVKLDNVSVKKALFVRGSLSLYQSQLGFVDVYGDLHGRDCTINDTVNLFGNLMSLENCQVQDVNLYYGGISAFAPRLILFKTKVLGSVHFYHRRGTVYRGPQSSIAKGVVNGNVVTTTSSYPSS